MNNDLASEIRRKTDIVDIIGERIPLVSRGNNFFGECPFHSGRLGKADNNPSLCVSRQKQIYTCFSCKATGNVFTFLTEYEHMDFREALHYLGQRVGVNVSGIQIKKKSNKFDKLYEAYRFSVKYYQNNLSSSFGKVARNYLAGRGITDEVIKEFEIGLSLDSRDDLTQLLLKKEYDLATLNKIGLSSDDRDFYNDRVMFPLYDVSGNVVGFSGRIYKENGQNKYLNTGVTDIFKKGDTLYHYHIAKEACRRDGSVIVMEGFMDVIRASTIGIKNTVAIMGTSLTNEQMILLKRLSNNIILCLDGDDPGVNAAINLGEMLLERGTEVKVVVLPDNDDPDTFIMKHGKERFIGLLDNAVNFNDFKISRLKENVDFRSDDEKTNYINAVLKELTKIDDSIRIELALKRLAKEFDLGYNTLEMQFNDFKSEKKVLIQQIEIPKENVVKKDKYIKAVEQILYFMLNNDWVVSQVERERLIFPSEESRVLSSEIIYYYKKYGYVNVADFYTYIQDKDSILVLLNSILAGEYNEKVTKDELFEYFKVVREYGIGQEIKRLTNLMKKEVDPLEQAKIVEKIRKLRIGE